jgi:hypothetical protein
MTEEQKIEIIEAMRVFSTTVQNLIIESNDLISTLNTNLLRIITLLERE